MKHNTISKPSFEARSHYIGDPDDRGRDETKSYIGYKSGTGYKPGARCETCINFPDEIRKDPEKQRGNCKLVNLTVSKNGLCRKGFKKFQPDISNT